MIKTVVPVKIQLYRPKDSSTSEPLDFRYRPNVCEGRKRPRPESFIPTVVGSHESPSYDSSASSTFGSSRQSQCAPFGFDTKFGSSSQSQHYGDCEDSMFSDSVPQYFGTITTSDLNLLSDEFSNFCPEEFSRLLDIEVICDSKLQTDGAGGASSSVRRFTPEKEPKILHKLKMLIKLFKNNFDSEKLHEMMMMLIDAQADAGENILLDCIEHGTHQEIRDFVLILVEYKLMDVLKSVNDLDQNCFHLLILAGNTSLLKVFLSLGVDVNQADAYGQTPLHLAVVHSDKDSLIELSKSSNIKLNELNDAGFTPLHLAVNTDNFELVKLLIEAGADVLKKSPLTGDTVLHRAVMNEATNMEMIAYLIGFEEELLQQTNNAGLNPLQTAVDNGQSEALAEYMSSYYRESYTKGNADSDDSDDDELNSDDSDEVSEKEESCESLFDDKCLTELCQIFDKDEKWKGVLMIMGLEGLTEEWNLEKSPSRKLFDYLEVKTYFNF
jgi:ankyrin repeat protein